VTFTGATAPRALDYVVFGAFIGHQETSPAFESVYYQFAVQQKAEANRHRRISCKRPEEDGYSTACCYKLPCHSASAVDACYRGQHCKL